MHFHSYTLKKVEIRLKKKELKLDLISDLSKLGSHNIKILIHSITNVFFSNPPIKEGNKIARY